jgi:hypothetical protein
MTIQPLTRSLAAPAPGPAAAPPAAPRDSRAEGRPERIRTALRKVALNVVENQRALGTVLAGEIVGIALGYTLIGGPLATAAAGAAGAAAATLLDRLELGRRLRQAAERAAQEASAPGTGGAPSGAAALSASALPRAGKAGSTALAAALGAFRAAPNILYPSIVGATAAERAVILDALDRLPLRDVASVSRIAVHPTLEASTGAAGVTQNLIWGHVIQVGRESLAEPGWNTHVVVHETGHSVDLSGSSLPVFSGHSGILGLPGRGPWGKPPYVVDEWDSPQEPYAATNHFEDFAQSYTWHRLRPQDLARVAPEKARALAEIDRPTLYDAAFERPGVRRFGREAAEALDRVPGLRTTLQVAAAILGPLTLRSGAVKLRQGLLEDDRQARTEGLFRTARGLAYTTRLLAPLGLLTLLGEGLVGRLAASGVISASTAEKIAAGTLAAVAGPPGMIAYAACTEMLRTGKGVSSNDVPRPLRETTASGREGLKQWYRTYEPASGVRGQDSLTRQDKVFMAAVGAGALLGGAAGTYAGWSLGAAAGGALGAALGGPLGAGIGRVLGGWGGSLAGSYAGARAGARAGRLTAESLEGQGVEPEGPPSTGSA